MNTKTLEAIRQHGENLLAIFPSATERDPVALCKKLRRIENAIAKPILDYTNGVGARLHRDLGGYGILAPDLTVEAKAGVA